MKHLILIFWLLVSGIVYANNPFTLTVTEAEGNTYPNGIQTLGNDSNVVQPKGGFKARVINWTHVDTAAANLQRIKNYPGAQIFTSSDNKFRYRNATATAWLESGAGWGLTGNSGTTVGTNFIGTSDDEDLSFKTNSVQRWRFFRDSTYMYANNGSPMIKFYGDNSGATKMTFVNSDGASMLIQSGDQYLETLTGWSIRNAVGGNNALFVQGATVQTANLIEAKQGGVTLFELTPNGAVKFNGSAGTSGQVLTSQGTVTPPIWATPGGGSGTVTSVSVVTNQGVSGSVATATTTPAITLSLGALTGVTSINGLVITANTGVITTGTWNGTDVAFSRIAQLPTVTLAGNSTGGTADIQAITLGTGLSFVGTVLTPADNSATNELQTVANTSAATTHTLTLSNSGGSIQLVEGYGTLLTTSGTSLNGIVTVLSDTATIFPALLNTIALTTIGGSGAATWNPATRTLNIPQYTGGGGGSVTEVFGTTNRITVATGTSTPVIDISPNYVGQTSITTLGTITTGVWNGTDVAFANIAQLPTITLAGNSTGGTADIQAITLGTGLSFVGTVLTPADNSATNELQTFANTSAATTHTVTLSNSGGSFQLAEGTNVTLTTTGTALDGIVTINAATPATYTSNSGLTMTANNTQLGGALLNSPTISGSTLYGTYFTGSYGTGVNNGVINITQSGTSGYAVYATNNGSGGGAINAVVSNGQVGITATATDTYGVSASATSGNAFNGSATSGVGVYGGSQTGTGGTFVVSPSSTNTIVPIINLNRGSSGTGATGIGGSIDFGLESDDGFNHTSNQIISKWSNATTASRVSEFSITGVNAAVTATIFKLAGSGQPTFNKLGIGTFTGTPAYSLSVDASGNVIETLAPLTLASGRYTPSGTGSSNVNSFGPSAATYLRVGNSVTVSGSVEIEITNCSAPASIDMSLPVATAMSASSMLAGVASEVGSATIHGVCYGDAGGDEVRIEVFVQPSCTGTGTTTVSYTYTYFIE